MAKLRLESYDRHTVELPDLCMHCGAQAAVRKSKTFSWFPPWIWILLFICGLLPFAIIALVMTKRRTVDVPLCEEHKNYWFIRQTLVIGSFLGICVLGVFSWILVMESDGRNGNPFGGIMCIGSIVLFVAWLIMAVNVQNNSIRPREITDSTITLVGVSKAFVEAYEEQWHVAPDLLDNLAREHWNQQRPSYRPGRSSEEDSDRILPADEEVKRETPPDTFQEGPS